MKKLFTLFALSTMILSLGFSQTCDTLFNLQSVLDTPTYYFAASGPDSGYISGNNIYGDLAKAEGFTGLAGDIVTSAVFVFAYVTINPSDSDKPLIIGVWDNTGVSDQDSSGAPGNLLDTTTMTLRQIANAVTSTYTDNSLEGVQVNFVQQVPLTTNKFYVGIYLPTTLGDTIVLFTNTVPPGPDGDGWEAEAASNEAGYLWGTYNWDWEFSRGSVGNYIAVDVCTPASTGLPSLNETFTIKVFPNPANDQLNIQSDLNGESDITIYDFTGNLIKSFTIQGSGVNTFDINDLATGGYIIRVTDKQTAEQHSTLFTKQ